MLPIDLAARVVRGERSFISKALSLVEDRRAASAPAIVELLESLRNSSLSQEAHRIGFTGPPGVGKSSLVAAVAREVRKRQRTVGILAVDPSSPRSGGALLGDRARIDPNPEDDAIFVRSMASGGDLGGLARAAFAAVQVLSAAYDVVLVETVGVGQSETDVEFVADTTVMVIQPASGDVLQFLKAGILEIPDVFVINKADLGNVAKQTRRDLVVSIQNARVAGLSFREPTVLSTCALDGTGVVDVVEAVERVLASLKAEGEFHRGRAAGACAWTERALLRRIGEVGMEALGGRPEFRRRISKRVAEGACGLAVALELEREAVRSIGRPE